MRRGRGEESGERKMMNVRIRMSIRTGAWLRKRTNEGANRGRKINRRDDFEERLPRTGERCWRGSNLRVISVHHSRSN